MKWPDSFYEMRRGAGCPICAEGRPDETRHGARIFSGRVADAYLTRVAIQRGYPVAYWRGRHVAADDPRPGWPFPFPETDPAPFEEQIFWADVTALRRLLGGSDE